MATKGLAVQEEGESGSVGAQMSATSASGASQGYVRKLVVLGATDDGGIVEGGDGLGGDGVEEAEAHPVLDQSTYRVA